MLTKLHLLAVILALIGMVGIGLQLKHQAVNKTMDALVESVQK